VASVRVCACLPDMSVPLDHPLEGVGLCEEASAWAEAFFSGGGSDGFRYPSQHRTLGRRSFHRRRAHRSGGSPVGGTVGHLWSDHIRPLAENIFYTKSQSNARYVKAAQVRTGLSGDSIPSSQKT
jgi:hypothetical protein